MTNPLQRPAVSPARAWSFPEPEQVDLGNGAAAWLYDLPSQHVLSCDVVMDAPVSLEPLELEGISTVAVRTCNEGSLAHPGHELAELLEDQGATYQGVASQSATSCGIEVPATRLKAALPVLAEIVRTPAFAGADVARHVALRLAEIEQSLARSSQLASLGFQRAVFDDSLRIGRPTGGRTTTVAAVTPDDIRALHERSWRPNGATIVLAGAIPADARQLLESAFGDWAPGPGGVVHQTPRPNPAAPVVWVVDRPDSVQADIQIGTFATDRNDPRWAALDIAGCAIGGSFGSRLNRVLREERGYTYGAHADFRPLRSGGTFVMRTSCRTEVAAAATAEALRLLDLAAAPFTDTEVDDARTYLLGVAPLHFQTADVIADQAVALAAAGIPPGWVNHHQAGIARATTDQVNEAFIEIVRPDRLNVVLCGNAEQLVGELAANGLVAEVLPAESFA